MSIFLVTPLPFPFLPDLLAENVGGEGFLS